MKKRALIVDDNSANLYMLQSLLRGEGFDVIAAENGKEALERAHADLPDVIVSDILMPVMDGYSLCRQCKADEHLKKIPFVFYTATYTERKDEIFALSIGADRFILKPQEPEILMNILKGLLEKKYTVKQVATKPLGEEMEFFRLHNDILFDKLEKKMLDLETVNQKLKCLEEQYRLSFENVTDIVWTIDIDFTVRKMSPSVEGMLGYKPQDLIGRSIADLVRILTPDSAEQAMAEIRSILKGETIPASVYALVAKDGAIKYGEVSGSPILRDGEIVGMVSVTRDITKRKHVEDELQSTNVFLDSIVENIPDMIFLKDARDLRYVRFNLAGEELQGYPRSDMLGKNAHDFFPKDQADAFTKIDHEVLRNKTVVDIPEERLLTRSRGERILHTKKVPLLGGDGEPLYLLGISEDITERKKAEEALRKSEEKYRGILENMDDAYYEVDLNGDLVFFNEALISKTGYSRGELMGMNYRQYVSPETRKAVSKVFSEIYKTGQPVRLFDYEVITKDGQIRNYESWANLLFDNNGQAVGFRGMARDITSRKEVEKQLQKTLHSLRNAIGTTIQVMVSAVEIRDPYTAGHQMRSSKIARAIAQEMGLSQEKIDGIRMAGSIHDIGKLSIPAEILSKPTKLSITEFSLIKEHSLKGYEMLKDVESPWPLAEIVYQHHERMDGSGYPRNLKGDEILMEARILAVSDVVESMASHRPYRPALGIDKALEEVEKNRGIFYDVAVADACLRLFREKGYQL